MSLQLSVSHLPFLTMYQLMTSRLLKKTISWPQTLPFLGKGHAWNDPESHQGGLGICLQEQGREWWMMINDERWMAMTNVKLEIHSFRNLQRFRFKTSLTNVSMVWLNRVGASNNNEETERITILCGIGSQDSDHFLGPFFWCRKKHPHMVHVTWYVTCIIHFCIIISQMVASTRRFWCQLNYFFWNFHPRTMGKFAPTWRAYVSKAAWGQPICTIELVISTPS